MAGLTLRALAARAGAKPQTAESFIERKRRTVASTHVAADESVQYALNIEARYAYGKRCTTLALISKPGAFSYCNIMYLVEEQALDFGVNVDEALLNTIGEEALLTQLRSDIRRVLRHVSSGKRLVKKYGDAT